MCFPICVLSGCRLCVFLYLSDLDVGCVFLLLSDLDVTYVLFSVSV